MIQNNLFYLELPKDYVQLPCLISFFKVLCCINPRLHSRDLGMNLLNLQLVQYSVASSRHSCQFVTYVYLYLLTVKFNILKLKIQCYVFLQIEFNNIIVIEEIIIKLCYCKI